jgi:uncharacterized RDD family membrane protein YckC/cytoskeletal protein CcmA (bactofilin family)
MNMPFPSRPLGAGCFLCLALAAAAQPSAPSAPGATSWDHPEGDRTQFMSSNRIDAGETVRGDVRTVMGSNTVAGAVSHDVVAVMGSDVIDGSVGHDVVAVMGSVVINGTVGHNVKAVMGDITLGPDAIVRGDVMTVVGKVTRAPGAIVRGRIFSQAFGLHGGPWAPTVVWNHDEGRSDWQENFHRFMGAWRWVFTLIFLGFYALTALLFPRAVHRCGDMLVERPALVVLASLGALLAVPLLFVLMLLTIIGIPVAVLLLPTAVFLGLLFGKAGIYGRLGRALTGDRLPLAGSVLLGGALCSLFYYIPILGLLVVFFLSLLGFGCCLTALLTLREARPAMPPPLVSPPAAPAGVPPAFVPPEPFRPAEPLSAAPLAAGPGPAAAQPIFSAALPRAGFWVRMIALFIDSVIISAACGSLFSPAQVIHLSHFSLQGMNWMLPLAIYGAMMWKLKGTTIGGMIFGLQVVRADGRPVDWETAIVRALACFLSTVLWLGFIWIAFDPEKQSWHDKIAGTVVVRTKGVSLV